MLALKIAVSVTLIWFLIGHIDIASARNKLFEVDPWMLALAIAVSAFQLVLVVMRWLAVLVALDEPIPFIKALQTYYIGIFFNQTLPSSVGGDAVRIYRSYRTGLTLRGAINGVMLERAATVVALIILVLFTQPFFLPRVGEENAAWLLPAVLLFAVVAISGLGVLMVLDRIPSSFHHWKVVRGLAFLAADTRRVFLNPANALRSLGWSVVGHLNITLAVYILALGIGIDITWIDSIALIPPVLLVTTLPISIAGWGVREGAMVAAFGLVGVPSEDALVLSLLFGIIGVITSLPGGLVWLNSGGPQEKRDMDAVTAKAEAMSGGPEE